MSGVGVAVAGTGVGGTSVGVTGGSVGSGLIVGGEPHAASIKIMPLMSIMIRFTKSLLLISNFIQIHWTIGFNFTLYCT
jgi:hypothetical protein